MERVHLDFLGPLPKTDKGNEYCLVMGPKIKLFLFPLTRPTMKKAADRKNYISKFEREFFFCGPGFYYFLVPAFSIHCLQALGNR